LDTSI